MSPQIRALPALDDATQAAVRALVGAAATADGVWPLNERALLDVAEPGAHLLVTEGELVAYGQVAGDLTAQVVVHPSHRRQGLGRALVAQVAADHPGVRFWAFGNLPAAQGLAAGVGYAPVRTLLIMERPLTDLPAPEPHPSVRLRPYTPADADALIAVNAAAFAGHPEQRAMDAADMARRLVSPDDIVLAVDTEAGHVLGFHWTKQHGDGLGEVYVIGVHPSASGRGLGRTLLWAGLHLLADNGCDRVILYVEGDNDRAVRLYETSGFRTVHTDVLYTTTGSNEGDRA